MIEIHPILPVYDANSRILILGSFPSVQSRAGGFYYHHPQNRFWPLLSRLLQEPLPHSIEEKKAMLLRHGIALWDVIASCTVTGSQDSSIRDVTPNDISSLLQQADIRRIFCNGATAYHYYVRYLLQQTGRSAQKLPSTSPANAAWSMQRLMEDWSCILD